MANYAKSTKRKVPVTLLLTTLLVLILTVSKPVTSQNCGCAPDFCCSKDGYCGQTDDYCGGGCKEGPCRGSGNGGGGAAVSLEGTVTPEFFNSIISQARDNCAGKGFYSHDAFIAAANSYPSFGSSISKREIAAFFAHVTQETEWFERRLARWWKHCFCSFACHCCYRLGFELLIRKLSFHRLVREFAQDFKMNSTEDTTKSTANYDPVEESGQPEAGENMQETNSSTTSKVTQKRSPAWLTFVETEDPDRARCIHCSRLIKCRTKSGGTTSAMKNHQRTCSMRPLDASDEDIGGKRMKQSTLYHQNQVDGSFGSKVPSFLGFSQPATRKALAEMIIMDELPFRFVERKGFNRFMNVAQPRFEMPCRKTVAKDCLEIYEDERSKLRAFFRNYKGSICLTTDCWTSIQNMSYMCLTAHFIDENWKLHKKVINFCIVDNHAGETIGKAVEKCLVFWGISKVFTITVDNASSNDLALKYLKKKLTSWGTTILNGEFLHMRCGAHILGLIVKDGLSEIPGSVLKIRSAVRYVRSSPSRLKKFKECLEHQKVETNAGLSLDVETRWNSTFLMLQSAVALKKGFDMLELEDGKYVSELTRICEGVPSESDWADAAALSPILQYFYDATVNISGSKYVTGNTYMKEIFGVGWMIVRMDATGDAVRKAMAEKMRIKFYKYWGNFDNNNLMIYVAAVLDPRYKMKWVKWMIEGTYPESEATRLIGMINDALNRLFAYYTSLQSQDSVVSSHEKTNVTSGAKEKKVNHSLMDAMYDEAEENEEAAVSKSEIEYYLDDIREGRKNSNFDILYWWKTTGSKYKILSLMARDLLAIPVSTVASESAFSTGTRVLDRFRSSLTPRTVEALICTQDWYRDNEDDLRVEELIAELENIESEVGTSNMQP